LPTPPIPSSEPIGTPPGNYPLENYTTSEHLAAIPHCNGMDYWIIVKPVSNTYPTLPFKGPTIPNISSSILAYRLTDLGIVGSPVKSNSGLFITPPSNTPSVQNVGQIEVSRDNQWVAITQFVGNTTTNTYLFSFDSESGAFTYLKTLTNIRGRSACFSPNSKVLYVSGEDVIYQYDLANFSTCNLDTPLKEIPLKFGNSLSLQLGPDDRIYVTTANAPNTDRFISVINFPNQINLTNISNEFGFNEQAIAYSFPINLKAGTLPNMIDASPITQIDFDYCIENCGEVRFNNLGCGSQFLWDFGDGNTSTDQNPMHTYTNTGSYAVSFSIDGGQPIQKTLDITQPLPPTIIGPNPVCTDQEIPVSYFAPPGFIYDWVATNASPTTGSGNSFDVFWLSFPADLTLIITDPETGCTATSTKQILQIDMPPEVNAGPDITICASQTAMLNGMIKDSESFVWTPNDDLDCSSIQDVNCLDPIVSPSTTTTYTLSATNGCGTASDQVTVTVQNDCCNHDINYAFSPPPFCIGEESGNSIFYINAHIPNWGGSQDFDFEFCGSEVTVIGGTLQGSYEVVADGCLFEIEGILEVPTNSLPGDVCFQVPICVDDENCIGEFCVQLIPCESECDLASIQEHITFLSEDLYDVNINAIISNPNGDKIETQIYSTTGQFSNTFSPYTSFADPVIIPTYNTMWHSSGNFLCYKVLIKNKTTGEKCTENICTSIHETSFENNQVFLNRIIEEVSSYNHEENLAINVYPTLVYHTLYIENEETEGLDYQIISSAGFTTFKGILSANELTQIDVSSLKNGIYFIQIKEEKTGHYKNIKFVIAR